MTMWVPESRRLLSLLVRISLQCKGLQCLSVTNASERQYQLKLFLFHYQQGTPRYDVRERNALNVLPLSKEPQLPAEVAKTDRHQRTVCRCNFQDSMCSAALNGRQETICFYLSYAWQRVRCGHELEPAGAGTGGGRTRHDPIRKLALTLAKEL
jgi:hypothetical protein